MEFKLVKKRTGNPRPAKGADYYEITREDKNPRGKF